MIDVIATRRTTLNGKTYQKNQSLKMPLQQFEDLEPTKRFARAPATKAAAPAVATKAPAKVKAKAEVSSPADAGTAAE